MSRRGRASQARREGIVLLASAAGVVVDVGCDHGYVAEALGAIGTELRVRSFPRGLTVPMIVADGLTAFARVDLAIVTGMGPEKILRILDRGPKPVTAIVHSPQYPARLRQGLADRGYRIDAERLAPEGGRFAEIIRVRQGTEHRSGHELWFGPELPGDPWLSVHAGRVRRHWQKIVNTAPPHSQPYSRARDWLDFLDARILPGCQVPGLPHERRSESAHTGMGILQGE